MAPGFAEDMPYVMDSWTHKQGCVEALPGVQFTAWEGLRAGKPALYVVQLVGPGPAPWSLLVVNTGAGEWTRKSHDPPLPPEIQEGIPEILAIIRDLRQS